DSHAPSEPEEGQRKPGGGAAQAENSQGRDCRSGRLRYGSGPGIGRKKPAEAEPGQPKDDQDGSSGAAVALNARTPEARLEGGVESAPHRGAGDRAEQQH